MKKYYTRACNFYYGSSSKNLIKKKLALPLCGNINIAFDEVEIFTRNKNKISSFVINIKKINSLKTILKKKISKDIKNISAKRNKFTDPTIMGILNMTPDSFSDGGKFNSSSKAFKQIDFMIKSGAEIIDVGGESTRPGSKNILPTQEWKRIKSVVKKFKKKYRKFFLSIDTRKSEIMNKAILYNADIINDVSGFKYDKKSLSVVRNKKIWKIIHHMQGTPDNMQINPKYKNVLLDIYDFFEDTISKIKTKNKVNKIILDPGIGFGKNLKHNLILLSKVSLFHSLGFPILIGSSRKRFISQISGSFDTKERIGGTLSSILFTLAQGVQIFRVHNVKEVKQGILVFKNLLSQ
ncbi:MAG: dihydropteroate synthase [Pelagibacteraceae bacterium]